MPGKGLEDAFGDQIFSFFPFDAGGLRAPAFEIEVWSSARTARSANFQPLFLVIDPNGDRGDRAFVRIFDTRLSVKGMESGSDRDFGRFLGLSLSENDRTGPQKPDLTAVHCPSHPTAEHPVPRINP